MKFHKGSIEFSGVPGTKFRRWESWFDVTGTIFCMCPANERRRYISTSPLIGWAHTKIIHVYSQWLSTISKYLHALFRMALNHLKYFFLFHSKWPSKSAEVSFSSNLKAFMLISLPPCLSFSGTKSPNQLVPAYNGVLDWWHLAALVAHNGSTISQGWGGCPERSQLAWLGVRRKDGLSVNLKSI